MIPPAVHESWWALAAVCLAVAAVPFAMEKPLLEIGNASTHYEPSTATDPWKVCALTSTTAVCVHPCCTRMTFGVDPGALTGAGRWQDTAIRHSNTALAS